MNGLFLRLSILLVIALAACQPILPKMMPTPTQTSAQPTLTPTGIQAPVSTPIPAASPSQPTPLPPTATQPVPTTTAISSIPFTAIVAEEPLNLRVGPGLSYKVLRQLTIGTRLQILGRSGNAEWVQVRTDNGVEGWVSRTYITYTGNLAALPVTEAYGGPIGSPTASLTAAPIPSGGYSVNVTIGNNIAVVDLQRYPANKEIAIRLGTAGKTSMQIATGKTNPEGTTRIEFSMPYRWSDGTPLTEQQLVLTAAAVDGSISRTTNIIFYR
jgi:hypothetical protein